MRKNKFCNFDSFEDLDIFMYINPSSKWWNTDCPIPSYFPHVHESPSTWYSFIASYTEKIAGNKFKMETKLLQKLEVRNKNVGSKKKIGSQK